MWLARFLLSELSFRGKGTQNSDKIIGAFKKSLVEIREDGHLKGGEGQSPFMTAQATCTAGRPFPAIVTIVTLRAEQ